MSKKLIFKSGHVEIIDNKTALHLLKLISTDQDKFHNHIVFNHGGEVSEISRSININEIAAILNG